MNQREDVTQGVKRLPQVNILGGNVFASVSLPCTASCDFLHSAEAWRNQFHSLRLCRCELCLSLSACTTSVTGYQATHRPQVNYTPSVCVCECVSCAARGHPQFEVNYTLEFHQMLPGKRHDRLLLSQLSHGHGGGSCCHHSLSLPVTHRHPDSATAVRKHYMAIASADS